MEYTVPESLADLAAQLEALLDDRHPKDIVYIPHFATPLYVEQTQQGTVITTDSQKAEAFKQGVTDNQMALLLGYPETKQAVIANGDPMVIQVLNSGGRVIWESLFSLRNRHHAQVVAQRFMPSDGAMRIISPADLIGQRLEG